MREGERPSIDPTLVKRVRNCRTANEAMKELAAALGRMTRPVDRASLRRVDAEEGSVELVGVWSKAETALTPGTTIPIQSTSFEDLMRSGKPVIYQREPYPPLLDHLLEQEGLRSWITIPLWKGASAAALLSLSSTELNAFGPDDIPLFEALGLAVSDALLGLTSPLGHRHQ